MHNSVRQHRLLRRLSQAEVARRVGISRQAVSLIESGQTVPNAVTALRLARLFGATVETLFAEADEADEAEPLSALPGDALFPGDRVVLCETALAGRFLRKAAWSPGNALATAPAAGCAAAPGADGRTSAALPPGAARDAYAVVAGCDIGLALLAEYARRRGERAPVIWECADSRAALRDLARGAANLAAVHGSAEALGRLSLRLDAPVRRIHFANWRLGWLVRKGNPCGFRGVDDLRGGSRRLVNRPEGAGARALLDRQLQAAGIAPADVPGYTWTAAGHLQVADAIAAGGADAGIAMESAAAAAGLDFIPLREEICQLWIPAAEFGRDAVREMLAALASDVFRRDLERLGPYDAADMGKE